MQWGKTCVITYQVYQYLLSLLRAIIFELLKSAQQHAKHSLISEKKQIKVSHVLYTFIFIIIHPGWKGAL